MTTDRIREMHIFGLTHLPYEECPTCDAIRDHATPDCPYCAADPDHGTIHPAGEHGTIHPDAVRAIGKANNATQRTDADILFDR
jgi:hypothetical protein